MPYQAPRAAGVHEVRQFFILDADEYIFITRTIPHEGNITILQCGEFYSRLGGKFIRQVHTTGSIVHKEFIHRSAPQVQALFAASGFSYFHLFQQAGQKYPQLGFSFTVLFSFLQHQH